MDEPKAKEKEKAAQAAEEHEPKPKRKHRDVDGSVPDTINQPGTGGQAVKPPGYRDGGQSSPKL